jgi:hypothetical protein
MQTITIYQEGKAINTQHVISRMQSACAEHAIDPDEMAALSLRLITDEDAREQFENWTGLEVVLD